METGAGQLEGAGPGGDRCFLGLQNSYALSSKPEMKANLAKRSLRACDCYKRLDPYNNPMK